MSRNSLYMRRVRDRSNFEVMCLEAPEVACQACKKPMSIVRNRRRPLQTLDKQYDVVLKDRGCNQEGCPNKGRHFVTPAEEAELSLLRKCEYGLDVIAWVGEQRLDKEKSLPKIHQELVEEHDVRISERHVLNLFRVFVSLVHCVNADTPSFREQLVAQGKLSLSIDGVQFDATSPVLYVVRDVLSGEVLYSERVTNRDGAHLAKLLERVKKMGIPIIGVVSDKEKAIVAAVENALPGVPHQYCQTHFLKNLVKPMEDELAQLGGVVTAALTEVKKLERSLDEKAEKLDASQEEIQLVRTLATAARAAARTSGDSILNPTALKRYERLQRVYDTAVAAVKGKKGKRCALLAALVTVLSVLLHQTSLARRLSQQVAMVRKVAHILNFKTSARQVRRMLATFLNKLERSAPDRGRGILRGDFMRHINALADRYWSGLFHCYDHEEIPRTNNEMEQMFAIFKRHERKVTGRKSTVGGPLETCAEFVLEAWSSLRLRPELTKLLKHVSDDSLGKARAELEKLAGPARTKRSIQRDPEGHLEEALATWLKS